MKTTIPKILVNNKSMIALINEPVKEYCYACVDLVNTCQCDDNYEEALAIAKHPSNAIEFEDQKNILTRLPNELWEKERRMEQIGRLYPLPIGIPQLEIIKQWKRLTATDWIDETIKASPPTRDIHTRLVVRIASHTNNELRKIAYAFLQLPTHQKIEIAVDLDVYEVTKDFPDDKRWAAIFKSIQSKNLLSELWYKIQLMTEDKEMTFQSDNVKIFRSEELEVCEIKNSGIIYISKETAVKFYHHNGKFYSVPPEDGDVTEEEMEQMGNDYIVKVGYVEGVDFIKHDYISGLIDMRNRMLRSNRKKDNTKSNKNENSRKTRVGRK